MLSFKTAAEIIKATFATQKAKSKRNKLPFEGVLGRSDVFCSYFGWLCSSTRGIRLINTDLQYKALSLN